MTLPGKKGKKMIVIFPHKKRENVDLKTTAFQINRYDRSLM